MLFKKAVQAIVLCGVVLTAGVAPSASALETKPVLSVDVAEKMALACDKLAASLEVQALLMEMSTLPRKEAGCRRK
jgi:hypothetical protein